MGGTKKAPVRTASKPSVARKTVAVVVTAPVEVAGKEKLVRDSFTIPKSEYETLVSLKRRSLALGVAAKKSELIRAGIAALNAMSDRTLLSTLKTVPNLKTGRPKGPVVGTPT